MTQISVALVGLGSMGLAMARNLLKAGFVVAGCDLKAEARAALAAAGGRACKTPVEAAEDAQVLLLMVVDAPQAEAVLFGPSGALERLAPEVPVVLSSTVPSTYARDLGARLAALGRPFLDAPVSGGRAGAEAGTLTIMAAGPRALFEALEPVLLGFGKRAFHLGEAPGVGSAVKAVNQLLAGVHLAAAAEAMAYGTAAGADPAVLFEVIATSAGRSWMFEDRVPTMLSRDFHPRSAVDIFVKDLGLVLDGARPLRFPLPLAAAAHQLFLMASAAGHGGEDDAAVVKVYETLTGVKVAAR